MTIDDIRALVAADDTEKTQAQNLGDDSGPSTP
jgi:hypothetical protein